MSAATRRKRRITQLAVGRHLPHRSARVRLTLLYGGLFLLSGAALVAITYVLFQQATAFTKPNLPQIPRTPAIHDLQPVSPLAQALPQLRSDQLLLAQDQYNLAQVHLPAGTGHLLDLGRARMRLPQALHPLPPDRHQLTQDQHQLTQDQHELAQAVDQLAEAVRQVTRAGSIEAAQRAADSHQLLVNSGIALAIVAVLALLGGWVVAGRVLEPLEDSYQAQRQFVANASHELRAPLTRQRALIEVALGDPEADAASLRTSHERVLASEQHLEQMIDGLLTLTRGQAGLERREYLDLAALASQALLARESVAHVDLDVRTRLEPAPTAGDPRLLERLIINLIDNALRHNTPGGHVEITTGTRDRRAFVSVANTGAIIPPEQIQRLFQPFQRLGGARTQHTNGHGLGLSIVEAVSSAHRADLTARARPQGGLAIEVSFPPTTTARSKATSALAGRQATI